VNLLILCSISAARHNTNASQQQIVYTAVVGTVMLAAFLEWFLWLAAFMYCLIKVYQKAEHWTVRVLAVVVAIFFALLRYVPRSLVSVTY
jgi:chitin synthase